jgi:catechol 2,3-dioxygenase-like lactoylglutathione lyase family enzyme
VVSPDLGEVRCYGWVRGILLGMKANLGHIGINVSNDAESFDFWKSLLEFFEFQITPDGNHFDASDGHTYLCVQVTEPGYEVPAFHRKRTGLNHLALRVASAEMVDEFVTAFLDPRGIAPLYGGAITPAGYPDGYYAVYFEDPDRLKVEVHFE